MKNVLTQKPLELFLRPIEYHTEVGDLCYEPFLGSGTQLIAAEKLGRVCYALEREPQYVDVAVKRWESFTGEQAVKENQWQQTLYPLFLCHLVTPLPRRVTDAA